MTKLFSKNWVIEAYKNQYATLEANKVFSFIFGMCVIVVNNERRPSVLNASNCPTSEKLKISKSDQAGFVTT